MESGYLIIDLTELTGAELLSHIELESLRVETRKMAKQAREQFYET